MRPLFAAAVLLAACTPRADAPAADEAMTSSAGASVTPNVVHVKAADFAFDMPDTIPAGLTTFHMMNAGPEFHHVTVIRFDDGHTMSDFMARKEGDPIPDWAKFVGGPNAAFPGGTNEATLNLDPGNYGLVCFIPSSDGVPHIAKGMSKALTVTANPDAPTTLPPADVTMTFSDYDFTLSQPLTAGHHVIRFENTSDQLHEVWMAKLAPGKTMDDVMAFIQSMKGDVPVTTSSGVTDITKGQSVQVSMDLEAGEYILLCFVPDKSDGQPHFVHGMSKTITVGT